MKRKLDKNMRIKNGYVKTTLKEDKLEIYAFAEAVSKYQSGISNDYRRRYLSIFKKNKIDRNLELFDYMHEKFLSVLKDHNIQIPNYNIAKNIEDGSWYPIPIEGKLKNGESREERLEKRRSRRIQHWETACAKFNLTESAVNQSLHLNLDEIASIKLDIENLKLNDAKLDQHTIAIEKIQKQLAEIQSLA